MPVYEPCTSKRNLINPQVNVTLKKSCDTVSEELLVKVKETKNKRVLLRDNTLQYNTIHAIKHCSFFYKNIFYNFFTHRNMLRISSLLNPVRLNMAEAHCGAAFEWYQQTSSDSFTPRRAGCINAAVTAAIRAGVSYHRTQAFLLLAHCCCHSSAPPERLPHSPHHADNTHTHKTTTKEMKHKSGRRKLWEKHSWEKEN